MQRLQNWFILEVKFARRAYFMTHLRLKSVHSSRAFLAHVLETLTPKKLALAIQPHSPGSPRWPPEARFRRPNAALQTPNSACMALYQIFQNHLAASRLTHFCQPDLTTTTIA
jgi:hypothetical protein